MKNFIAERNILDSLQHLKIIKKQQQKNIYFEIAIFFSNFGKKSPKFHWERGRNSAPEKTKRKSLVAENFHIFTAIPL